MPTTPRPTKITTPTKAKAKPLAQAKALSLAKQAQQLAARTNAAPRPATPVTPPAARKMQTALEKSIYSMALEHVQCRDFGHSWRPFQAHQVPGGFKSVLRCARCTTIRIRMLGTRGQLLDSGYDYVDGYLMDAGHGRLSSEDRDIIRLASVRSVLVKDAGAK